MARAEGITGGILPDGPIVFDEAWKREREGMAAREAATAEYAVELRRRCGQIDLLAGKYMAPQLERQKPLIKPIDKARCSRTAGFLQTERLADYSAHHAPCAL